jgi:protein DGCR14
VVATTLAPAAFVPDEAPRVVDKDGNHVDTSLNLDRFVASYTSEDNASYQQLSDRAHQQFRERNSWVEEAAVKNQLLLESAESQERGALRMWNYSVRNRLMYYPDAIEPAASLAVVPAGDAAAATTPSGATMRGAPKAVVAENTRFVAPLPVTGKRRRDAVEGDDAATGPVTDAELIARRRARLRDDAPDALTGDSADDSAGGAPRVRGYGFVSSPSPAPGVDASPIVTWGEIGGTPMRLSDRDAGDTGDAAHNAAADDDDERWLMAALAGAEDAGSDGAPSRFRMQPTPERDELLHSLAATLAARKRRESARRAALSSAAAAASATTTSTRAVPLSPAAKRLMRAMTPQRVSAAGGVGSLGDALRRTYQSPAATSTASTPTTRGARSSSSASKPLVSPAIRITPRRRADATPQRQANALLASIAAESGGAPTTSSGSTAQTTITDNLL